MGKSYRVEVIVPVVEPTLHWCTDEMGDERIKNFIVTYILNWIYTFCTFKSNIITWDRRSDFLTERFVDARRVCFVYFFFTFGKNASARYLVDGAHCMDKCNVCIWIFLYLTIEWAIQRCERIQRVRAKHSGSVGSIVLAYTHKMVCINKHSTLSIWMHNVHRHSAMKW